MKLVFVTQVLDRQDAVLGFVVRWVEGLARVCERVHVIALEVGDTSDLPDHVEWTQIGRKGRVLRYLRYRRALARSFRGGFDGLLTHMVPRYSTLAAPLASRAGATHFLWYTHKGVDDRLRAAIDVVDGAFTASEESLRIDTPKKIVTGHGIDAQHFEAGPSREPDGRARLLSVGRFTPAKDPLTVVEAIARLRDRGRDVTLTWVGGALARGDDDYATMVKQSIEGRGLEGVVRIMGAVPYVRVPQAYAQCDLFVNASRTGSVDKVVLEAMAARRPFVSCNESIPPVLRVSEGLSRDLDAYAFRPGDAVHLAEQIGQWLDRPVEERRAAGDELRDVVATHHDVDRLMERLVDTMEVRATVRAASR